MPVSGYPRSLRPDLLSWRRLALACALLLSAGPAGAQDASTRIAAVVNDEVITSQDVDDRINLVLATGGVPNTPEIRRRLTPQVVRGMVDERLQLQEAKRLNVTAGDKDVDQALETIAKRNNLDLAGLERALAERGVADRILRDQIRAQIAWGRVVGRELRPKVAVTRSQVQLALKNQGQGGETELLLSEILLPVDKADQQAQVLAQARDIAATLKSGADFGALARQVSVAASAAAGGDLGWVRVSTILPDYRDRLLSLGAGQVSEPLASPVGVSIFEVRAKRVPGQPVTATRFDVQRVDLAQVIFPVSPGPQAEAQLKAAEGRAREARNRFKSCGDVERLGPQVGGDGSGRLGWLALRDMPPALGQFVGRLEPRVISQPLRSPLGVQLLMVCDRQGKETTVEVAPAAAPPPPPTPEQARQQLEREQLDRLANRYLRDLREDAFIEMRTPDNA